MRSTARVRPPAVAGLFYPSSPAELASAVEELLATAAPRGSLAAGAAPQSTMARPPRTPKAIITPHAGYVYSGPIAASAFTMLGPLAREILRVVLIGPAHRLPFRGLALPGVEAYATPLGEVPVDLEAAAAVRRLPQVVELPAAHEGEHSLEVELPFLQMMLGAFRVLPLVVGEALPEEVAEVLELAWGGPESVLVISSDLSHYLPAAMAERADRATADEILRLGGPLEPHQACGAMPINGLLAAARRRGLAPELIDLRHSGDTAGDRSRVVGYGAFAFHEQV
jgi:AmmeMemoRadiSam system protein B